jgi:hypothetical protein
MESKAHDDHDTSEDEQEEQPLTKTVVKEDTEQAQGITQRIQDFISNIAKTGQPHENGQKLNCPTCGKNCHTLHQEGAISMGKPDHLETSLSKGKRARSTQNPPGLKLNCLHCGSPCHVVAELSTKGLQEQSDQDDESPTPAKRPKQEEEVKDFQSPADASDQEEGTKEPPAHDEPSAAADVKEETLLDRILNYLRNTPDKTKLDCPQCGQPCHSLDNNEPDSYLQMIGKLFRLANNNIKEKTESTKQKSSNSYFVGKLKCGSCDKFCHRIYRQDPDNQGSDVGETSEEDPESADAKV